MEEIDKEDLGKLQDEAEKVRARMRTKQNNRMKTLATLVSELPMGHPDLVLFRQDWMTERAVDIADLKQIENMQDFLTGLNSTAAASTAITSGGIRSMKQPSTEVVPPDTETGLSTDSDAPLMVTSLRRRAPPSATPQMVQGSQLDSTFTDSSLPLPPPSLKMAGREAERFEECPVIVRHAQLGWLELQCNVCGGNSQEMDGKYLLGMAGMGRHLAHRHSKIPTGTRRFGTDYILGKCARRLTSAEVDAYRKAVKEGRDPIVKRPCCAGDDEVTTDYSASGAGASEAKPSRHNRSLKRSRNDALIVDIPSDLSTPTLPSKRLRHGTSEGGAGLVRERAARRNTIPQHAIDRGNIGVIALPIKIASELSCPAVCHHPTKGPFILICPFCKGNAFLSSQSTTSEFLGPQTLFGHIRQAHIGALEGHNGTGEPMHLSAFQNEYVASNCVDRWLTAEEYKSIMRATASGSRYSPIKRNPVKAVVDDHETKFPTLCFEHFPSVILREDLRWVDLRCPHCSANTIGSGRKYFQGIKGFMRHITTSHGLSPPDPSTSWKWLLDQCSEWSTQPEVDLEKLESGLHVIPAVPPVIKELIVKLKLPSSFYKNPDERKMVQRMQAVLPLESKAKLLAVLKANNGNFDNAIDQLLGAIEESDDSVIGDTTDSEPHRKSLNTAMLGLLSLEEQTSVMRMRRIFPSKSVENCLSTLRAAGGNADQALDHLMKELEKRSTSLFTFDAVPTPASVIPNARAQATTSYTPPTPTTFTSEPKLQR
ncbi:hypothetical protein FKW77_010790 [Venturia effusa]|uniref:CUE domain-containing protein n=1 Tax=Venturia effusa TaxID=50376 RepID=A0A517KYH4_9PEZI|nr:hypothetical protein FKW77_010790 [Venturia effusa]